MSKTKKIVFTVLLGIVLVWSIYYIISTISGLVSLYKHSKAYLKELAFNRVVFNTFFHIFYYFIISILCLFGMFFLLKNATSILWKKTKFSIEEWQKEKQQKEKKKIEAKINKIETKRKDLEKRL